MIDTACLNVGGHLIETDESGRVRACTNRRLVCNSLFGEAQDPMRLSRAQKSTVAQRMSNWSSKRWGPTLAAGASAAMTPRCAKVQQLDAIFISGGVGACLYQPGGDRLAIRLSRHRPLFANAPRRCFRRTAHLREPAQTVRATVIGAGAHTLSLSGSTIWVSAASLPIKNLPVAHTLLQDVPGLCVMPGIGCPPARPRSGTRRLRAGAAGQHRAALSQHHRHRQRTDRLLPKTARRPTGIRWSSSARRISARRWAWNATADYRARVGGGRRSRNPGG